MRLNSRKIQSNRVERAFSNGSISVGSSCRVGKLQIFKIFKDRTFLMGSEGIKDSAEL